MLPLLTRLLTVFPCCIRTPTNPRGGPRVVDYTDDAKTEAATLLVGKLLSERPPNKTVTREAIQKSWSFV